MIFRFYITDLYADVIEGTNDEELAREHSLDEGFFVVDTEKGLLLTPIGDEPIEEVGSLEESDEE